MVREVCKFLAGLVAGDLLAGIWVKAAHLYTAQFFGVTLTPSFANAWIVVDIILLILLIHYAWKVNIPLADSKRPAFYVVGVLLTIVAIAHIVRLFFAVGITIGGVMLPLWVSLIGAIVTAWLAYASFHLAARR